MLEALKLVVQLVQALVWPAFAVFLVLKFHRPLTAYVEKLGQASVKLPGFELSLSQVAASAAAAGAVVAKQAASEDQPVPEDTYRKIAAAFAQPAAPNQRPINQRSILWVDDNPQGNAGLANAFRTLGVNVVNATSTDEAERAVAASHFDLIISDMSRPPDPEAGKTLVAALKKRGVTTPVIIYAARWAAQHREEAASFGVRAITNDPGEVYSVAMTALQQG